jgi:two-component system chemotaxis response regulator CheY
MSPAERSRVSILVIESDAGERNNLKTALKSQGYGMVSDAPNHATALERMAERPVSHVIFEAKKTNMPAKEFLQKVLQLDAKIVALPTSFDPNLDDVFDLLVVGARGYIVKPYTADTLESALLMASKGEPLSEAVLTAKDRNEALVAILMGSLDKTATVLRQAARFDTAKREIPRALSSLRRSAELAKTFAKGGDEGLIEAMEKFCIERSKGPATRLGRLRKRLKTNRVEDEEEATP